MTKTPTNPDGSAKTAYVWDGAKRRFFEVRPEEVLGDRLLFGRRRRNVSTLWGWTKDEAKRRVRDEVQGRVNALHRELTDLKSVLDDLEVA